MRNADIKKVMVVRYITILVYCFVLKFRLLIPLRQPSIVSVSTFPRTIVIAMLKIISGCTDIEIK